MAVSVETAVVRERDDAEGRFLKKALGPNFFPTSSGYMECVSASGRKLGKGGDPRRGLAAFMRLPALERRPGAVKVPEMKDVDQSVAPPPPPRGGLVLKMYGRLLRTTLGGGVGRCEVSDFPLMTGKKARQQAVYKSFLEPSPDFVWFTADDARALMPGEAKVDARVEVPAALVERLCLHHLTPRRVYAEGGEWHGKDLRHGSMTLVVTDVNDDSIVMRVEGRAHMGTEFDPKKAKTPNGPLMLGYAPRFRGTVEIDRHKDRIVRFDMVALGDAWGRMGDANNRSWVLERPGRNPVGFAFELVSPSDPANRIVPMGRASKLRSRRYLGR